MTPPSAARRNADGAANWEYLHGLLGWRDDWTDRLRQRLAEIPGRLTALVPASIPADRQPLPTLATGADIEAVEAVRDALGELLKQQLGAVPDAYCAIVNRLETAEPWLAMSRSTEGLYAETDGVLVYRIVGPADIGTTYQLRVAVSDIQYRFSLSVVGQCSEGAPPETPLERFLGDVVDSMRLLVVGAFDNEGFLIWERTSLNVPA